MTKRLIDKDLVLAAFDRLVKRYEKELKERIEDEDYWDAARREAWLSGLDMGRVLIDVSKEVPRKEE